MKKIIIAIALNIVAIQAWEINTHRAIDKKAIEKSSNLTKFIASSGIGNYHFWLVPPVLWCNA